MGFLTTGKTLAWEEARKYAEYIQKHGITQFLHIYENLKNRHNDCLKWGDEIEYIVVTVDEQKKETKICLRGEEILDHLMHEEHEAGSEATSSWKPEYGCFMVEGTPAKPYGGTPSHFRLVHGNMALRRKQAEKHLKPNERVLTITAFPLLGVGVYTEPPSQPFGPSALSEYTSDDVINSHNRFRTLTANIRKRRGSKVCIKMPLFQDKNTQPEKDGSNTIHMDSMAFGMGCCCLQCTYQCCNINEARHFYDQFAVLAPIMLALTAATPILRGRLADSDVRWNVIAGSVDDRTPEERGLEPLKDSKYVINKSRYDSIDCFISLDPLMKAKYNDLNLIMNHDALDHLSQAGVDTLLARTLR
eukprot:TRINITY_DN2493_c0_g1_i2.p1 TRINITY_DN2493_c0_g1~~TRINITY_DN2493_c0_g1_i2.p1  ORF type:complete len:394 (+),score=100.58 TRINITY_DN2493_c0_g1_i2:103-1182(+)